MLTQDQIMGIAAELAVAARTHGMIPRITARFPEATIDDAYAIQGICAIGRSRPDAGSSAARSA